MAQRLYGVTGDMELTGDVPVGREGMGKDCLVWLWVDWLLICV